MEEKDKKNDVINDNSFLSWVERNQKIVITILVLIFIRLLFRSKKSEPKKADGGKDMEVLRQNTSGATLTEAQASVRAERLAKAMNVLSGTDEDEIFEILGNVSLADYNMIYNAFGIRYYNVILGEQAFYSWMGRELDLNGWLTYELTTEELKLLKKKNTNLPL